jgi:hypothetical protein
VERQDSVLMMCWKEFERKPFGPNGGAISALLYVVTEENHKYFMYCVRFPAKNRTECYQTIRTSVHKPARFPLLVDVLY